MRILVSVIWSAVLAITSPSQDGAGLPANVSHGGAPTIARAEGPLVLAAGLEHQWGGHAFSYVLEGHDAVFWTALDYHTADVPGTPVVGQVPKPGSDRPTALTPLPLEVDDLFRAAQPLLVRTPDGYLHAFVGFYVGDGPRCGRVRYFRSQRPEDASEFLVRGDLPRGPFVGFQIRQNVALSRDGSRLAYAILSCFARGQHVINTPLLILGRREGLDFRFDEPVVYGDPMPFFYPLVAATDDGIVMVASLHDPADTRHDAKLVHLDWQGKLLHQIELPAPDEPGDYVANALQPLRPDDWTRLILVRALVPDEGTVRHIEFWEYDTSTRTLDRRRSIRNDYSLARSITNAGEILPRQDGSPLFLNNPASGPLCIWEGDLLADGALRICPLPRTDARLHGYTRSRSVFAPNVLQGSLAGSDDLYVAADWTEETMVKGGRGPCTMVLWRLRLR